MQFLGHHTMARDLMLLTPPRIDAELEEMPPVTEQRQEWLHTGIGPSGVSLTAEQVDALEYSVRIRRGYCSELQELELIPPDLTFDGEIDLHLGGRFIRLVHVDPAHTPGDVVIHLPEEGVLAVGDVIEEWLPYAEHGDIPGWARALERLRGLGATTVVASHADPANGPALLEWQAEFFGELVAGAGDVRARGGGRDAATAQVTLDRYLERFQEFGVSEEAYREWVAETVGQAWDQSQGGSE